MLARIERCEPQLHATYALDADAALSQARASEARWLRAASRCRPLDGVPGTIKENIATRGTPMPVGTAATVLAPAADDAPPAARLREAGAVIAGQDDDARLRHAVVRACRASMRWRATRGT